MRRAALAAVIAGLLAASAGGDGAAVVPPSYAPGQSLAIVPLVDDSGRARSLDEWRGTPLILVPIFTRCPLACPLITRGLIRGLAESDAVPGTYRVILFSFDPRDTPATLKRFRERQRVPIGWTVATAAPADIRRLMESVSFRYSESNGMFAHPNMVVVATPELQTARYLFGTTYPGSAIDEALDVARGGSGLTERYGPVLLALLLFVCVSSGGYLVSLMMRMKTRSPA